MRLFFAIALDDAQRLALAAAQDALRPQAGRAVRWVAPETAHLTLVFLGTVDAGRVDELLAAAEGALASIPAPTLRLGPAGAFPNVRRPRALWLGLAAGTHELALVQAALATTLEKLGFAREPRAFRPHLTLGRVREQAHSAEIADLAEALARLPAPAPTSWKPQAVGLYHSELLPQGPRYTLLGEALLGGQEFAT
jgi:2'-5' RNA ligase